jgi:hypothetical protein
MPQMPNISATSSGMGRVMQRAIKLLMKVTLGWLLVGSNCLNRFQDEVI